MKHHPLCELDPPCHPDCLVGDGRTDPAGATPSDQGAPESAPQSSSSSLLRSTEGEALTALRKIHALAVATCERPGTGIEDTDDMIAIKELSEAALRASSAPPPVNPDKTTTRSRASEHSDAGERQDLREVPDTKGSEPHLLCTACNTRVENAAWAGACPRCGNGTMREVK